jgi:hypothetical protein
MVKQALQNPGILTCHPSSTTGSQVGDDWAAMQADLDRGAPCHWYGTYFVSKPLEVKSASTSINGADATKTGIIPHTSWNYTNDHQLMRNWAESDWTVGETNHFLAPAAMASQSLYPRIRGVRFQACDSPVSHDIHLLHWSNAQERSYIRDCIFHAGNVSTGATKNIVGLFIDTGLNFHTEENLLFYGFGYRNALRIAATGGNYHLRNFIGPATTVYESTIFLGGAVDANLQDIHMEGVVDQTSGNAYIDVLNSYHVVLNVSQSFSQTNMLKPWLRVQKTGGASPDVPILENCSFILTGSNPKFSVPFIQDWVNTIDFQSTTIAGQAASSAGIMQIEFYDGESIRFTDGNGGPSKTGYFRNSPVLPGITDAKLNATYLACSGANSQGYSTPDAAAFDLTTGIDLRALVTPDLWARPSNTQPLICKYAGTTQKSYRVYLNSSTGRPIFNFTLDGATDRSALATAAPTGTVPTWVRVTADPVTGGQTTVIFYTSTDGVTWTQLGTTVNVAVTGSFFSGTSSVTVAQFNDNIGGFLGKFYKAEIRSLAGTLVDDVDFTAASSGAAITGTNGAVWTAGSASSITTTRTILPAKISPGTSGQILKTSSGGVATWTADSGALPAGGVNGYELVTRAGAPVWAPDQGDQYYYNGQSATIRANMPRTNAIQSAVLGTTGTMTSYAILLYAGDVVTNITFRTSSTAAGTPTAYWFALYDASATPALMAQTADQGSAAWAAATVKTLALSSPQTIPTTGVYRVALGMAASTMPTLIGAVMAAGTSGPLVGSQASLAVSSGSGLTTTAPSTVTGAITLAGIGLATVS